jgi:hypothetical protein
LQRGRRCVRGDADREPLRDARADVTQQRFGLREVRGVQPYGVQRIAQRGPRLQRAHHAGGRALAEDHQPPGVDVRQHLVEDARGLARVHATQQDLHEIGHEPHEPLGGTELGHHAPQTALELADVFLPAMTSGPLASNTS